MTVQVVINKEKLDKAIEWFTRYIVLCQKGGTVDFYTGFMQKEEGYKRDLFDSSHAALAHETWKENMIGTHQILDYVISGLNAKDKNGRNNIVNYHSITDLKEKSKKDIVHAEDILYRLYNTDDIETAFSDACEFYGKRYPILSYLLFMKDCTIYLPVNNSEDNHMDRFRKLGIDTNCLHYCSWENYQEFLQVHKEIRDVLQDRFDNVSLLDAHSFVWTLYAAPDDFGFEEENKLREIKGGKEFIEEVEKRKDYKKKALELVHEIDSELDSKKIEGIEREAIVKQRVNQGVFRDRLLSRYEHCCMCNVRNKSLLMASHIKPWSESSPEEKIDPDNGFLLCPNHDRLFDKGWITFEDNGKIVISDELEQVDRMFMNVSDNMKISLRKENKKYLEYHRKNVFHRRDK